MTRYTAQDMREMADFICGFTTNSNRGYFYIPCGLVFNVDDATSMLRQAADMRERLDEVSKVIGDELKKQKHCRECEWRRKSIRSEPTCPCDEDVHGVVFDIGVTDRIVKALRGDIEREEREKMYEYSVRYKNGELSCLRDTKPFKDEDVAAADCICVRREVGEWEEVGER